MADLAELEARIRHMEDIEAIKRLRHKYFRCLDGKLWGEMEDCFAEDVKTSYFNGEFKTNNKAETVQFFSMGLTDTSLALHHGHHPEIDLTGDTTATGIWCLYNYLIEQKGNTAQRVGGIYHDEYVKVDGKWKIKSIVCNQIFQETWDRQDMPTAEVTLRGTPQFAATNR